MGAVYLGGNGELENLKPFPLAVPFSNHGSADSAIQTRAKSGYRQVRREVAADPVWGN